MARPSSSFSGRGSASIPGTPGLGRRDHPNGRAQDSNTAYIEIDDNDLDELANDGIPCSSPYFTQPTQIVSRATQPTQIVNRAPRLPSSPLVPNTPSTAIEVPASSPFQAKGQARPSGDLDKKSAVASRVGSLMAPAGTSFKPPTMRKLPQKAGSFTGQRRYLDISDDDLIEDYKKQDSSDDDTPVRGDIKPSSFEKKENPSPSLPKTGATWSSNVDISLNDIRDIRLRHLTGQVYKIVQRAVPGVSVRACKEALQKDVGWQVSKAVDRLTGRPTKALSSSRGTGTSNVRASTKNSERAGHKTDTDSNPTSRESIGHGAQSRNSLQTFLKKTPSNATSTGSSSQTSTKLSRTQSSTNSTLSIHSAPSTHSTNSIQSIELNTNNNLPRRRLLQDRHESTTPSAVFSASPSSASSITSPFESRQASPVDDPKMALTTLTRSSPEAPSRPRRRLIQGRRHRSPTPPPITISSDSESDSSLVPPGPVRSRKRKSDEKDQPQPKKTKVDVSGVRSRKRKNSEDFDLSGSDFAPSPTKKAKSETPEPSQDGDEVQELHDQDDTTKAKPTRLANVLEYLNTCTVEALGRMIGSTADAKLMVNARPFETIDEANNVTRLDKSKSKKRAKRVAIGEGIVEKLRAWLGACEAATAVINECDKRGSKINSIMSTWSINKNGEPKTDRATVEELPIGTRPELMSDDIQLKSYQMVGLNWMSLLHSRGYSGILADDMGLGKTCQVISFIAHLVGSKQKPGARRPWPNLVVVPPSTFENWMAEFEKFAPGLKVLAYSGKSRRDILPKDARKHHVVLTTYPQVERQREDLRFLQDIEPYAAIFDEGHRLKNQDTLIYRQMMRVPTEWRLVLSGTPVQNNLKELLTLLRFIEPSLFGENSFEKLNTIFEAKVASKDVLNFAALASERVERARAVMAPFILQRRKEDVLELPKKTERLEIVGMHDIQKQIYDSIKGNYLLQNGVKKSKEAHPWMQLKKASIHHQLFRHHFTDEIVAKMVDILWKNCSEEELGVQSKESRHKARLVEELSSKSDFQLHLWCKDFEKYIGHLDIAERSWEDSPKVQKLLELVRGYMKNGDRVLVFSRFEMVIDILRETLHHADIKYCVLTGSIDTSDRFPECQRFTDNPDIPVFLITTGAGGTGLNLTAANKIILFDQSDNPQEDVQASNRAHRIGQTRDVEIVRIITEKSVEGLIYNSCVKKLVLAARVEREFGVEEEEESVEEHCKKLMLLDEEVEAAEVAPSTQQAEV